MRSLLLVTAMVFGFINFVGCTSVQAPPTNTVIVKCGHNRTWTPSEQDRLADALGPVSQDNILWTLEMDWQQMRDENKACQTPPAS